MKKFISLILVLAICMGSFQPIVLAENSSEDSNKDNPQKEIDQSTYDALGLIMNEDEAYNSLTPPYSTTRKTPVFTGSEVYLASNNGYGGGVYTLRDGLDRMNLGIKTDRQDDYGQLSGAYEFYGISNSGIKAKHGNTPGGYLSSNRGSNVITKTGGNGHFDGIYATSVAFNGGDDKDNYVAELRAHGITKKIEVVILKIDKDGTKYWIRDLTPTSKLNYFDRRYIQELDAMFEIEAADVNGDGVDRLLRRI